jgi:hypothetical protein
MAKEFKGNGLCVGYDSANSVSSLYSTGFPFTGAMGRD